MPEGIADDLEQTAIGFIRALPASIELPAGAGKTHLLATAVRYATSPGGKVLVLTHTNAGVQAIRARLQKLGVTSGAQVTTITSFAFRLARAYPNLGEFIAPRIMLPDDSHTYVNAATRALASQHLRAILTASYSHVFVDEYQDCNIAHHALVLGIREAIGNVGVLGDPLQAIFGFSEPLPDWNDVLDEFPKFSEVTPKPRRWEGENTALGNWLFEIRPHLIAGKTLPLATAQYPPGVTFTNVRGNPRGVTDAVRGGRYPSQESVLIISARYRNGARAIASQLGGSYTVMEEVAGSFMSKALSDLQNASPEGYAHWLFNFTKQCHAHSGILDPNPLGACYAKGDTGGHLLRRSKKRHPVRIVIESLDRVVDNPTLAELANAMDNIQKSAHIRLHSHEAWSDAKVAIRGAAAQGEDKSTLHNELAKARNSLRYSGHRERLRVISRTLLVKGLEYDHVIIADAGNHTEVNDLYVALTRARKSIQILASDDTLRLAQSPRGPKAKKSGPPT